MRAIDLEFQPPGLSGTAVAALLAGGLAMLAVFADYQGVSADLAHWRAELARVQAPPPGAEELRRAGDEAQLEQSLQAARRVAADIRRPWGKLLAALEAAQDPDIALLTLAPDAARGVVALSGEARRREAILAYMGRLAAGGVLKNVVLVEDQLQQQDPEKPFRFSLTADWVSGGKEAR